MTERHFNSSRLFKLVKVLVIIFSISIILLGIYGISVNGQNVKYFDKTYQEQCGSNRIPGTEMYCSWLITAAGDEMAQSEGFIGIGIGALILFYGGVAVYKYLNPISERK